METRKFVILMLSVGHQNRSYHNENNNKSKQKPKIQQKSARK